MASVGLPPPAILPQLCLAHVVGVTGLNCASSHLPLLRILPPLSLLPEEGDEIPFQTPPHLALSQHHHIFLVSFPLHILNSRPAGLIETSDLPFALICLSVYIYAECHPGTLLSINFKELLYLRHGASYPERGQAKVRKTLLLSFTLIWELSRSYRQLQ